MGLPLVTVCIPVYNHQHYVGACIQSVIDQDYENIELIIIDDGSKDDSAKEVSSFVDLCNKRFSRFCFISRENRGVSATLNQALDWAKGKYFYAIASDDILLIHKTSILVCYLEERASCAAVFGGIEVIDSAGKLVGRKLCRNKEYRFTEILLMNYRLPAPASLCRLDLLRAVGGYDPEIRIEDWYMWLKLSFEGYTLDSIPQPVAKYRMHGLNTVSNIGAMYEWRNEVLNFYRATPFHQLACAINTLVYAKESIRQNGRKQSIALLRKAIKQCVFVFLSPHFIKYLWIFIRTK